MQWQVTARLQLCPSKQPKERVGQSIVQRQSCSVEDLEVQLVPRHAEDVLSRLREKQGDSIEMSHTACGALEINALSRARTLPNENGGG